MSNLSLSELHSLLDNAVEAGGLRRLDRAVAQFLAEHGEADGRVLLAAAMASAQLGHGHTCLDLAHALRDAGRLLYADQPDNTQRLPDWSLADWQAALSQSACVGTDEQHPDRPLHLNGSRLYLRRQWQYESQVAAGIQQRLQQLDLPLPALRDLLDELFPQDANTPQPDWQKVACALAARSGFAIITGGPGTGKTTTVVRLLGLLQTLALQQGSRSLRIRLAAPTGKAAARLNESIAGAVNRLAVSDEIRASIPSEVTTLHRLLGPLPDSRRFRHHRGNPLHLDVLVIDEASMIDLEMMALVLDAQPSHARLILLGDKDQLASVEAGAVLGDLCAQAEAGGYSTATSEWLAQASGCDLSAWHSAQPRMLDQHVAMLRFSRRFAGDSGIGRLASAVNAGQLPDDVWNNHDTQLLALNGEHDPQLDALCFEGYSGYLSAVQQPPQNADEATWEEWADGCLSSYSQFQLLTPLRQGPWGVDGLNQRIAEHLHQHGLLSSAHGWYAGRPVLMSHNDYQLGLMNGDVGLTLTDPTGELVVVFKVNNQLKRIRPSRLPSVSTVFAMTVHKSQGSEFRHTALVMPPEPSPLLTRELLYTGITRAQQRFTLLSANPALLKQAATTRTERASGLGERFCFC